MVDIPAAVAVSVSDVVVLRSIILQVIIGQWLLARPSSHEIPLSY